MLAAESEHFDNPTNGSVERRSSCRTYAHLTDITTSTSFQRISGLLKSNGFCVMQTYIRLLCWIFRAERISRFVHQSAYALSIYWDSENRLLGNYVNESGCTYTWEKLVNQRSCCTRPGVETGSRMTLPLELNDSTLSSSCLPWVCCIQLERL